MGIDSLNVWSLEDVSDVILPIDFANCRRTGRFKAQQLRSVSTITPKHFWLSLLQSAQWVEQYINDK